ncbi:endonuclease/exonuclease/phosphatase family protein [Changchengzhania lutea]|uniref:endonuclease/exonuclease/phosphatase family protein n=1 Tax=Changchengzhania lutea TaxID=2049305 RepID=UPI00115E9DD3|nr:endonuclease/exonuclease/phosphatase family protein [Changchengzhania lutea]
MLRIVKTLIFLVNVLIIIALLLIHFVIKDTTFKTAIYFYALPLPVIVGIILFLALFLGKAFRKVNLYAAGILLIFWFGRSLKINFPENIKRSDKEIVFWNASRDNGFEEAFEENNGVPDVMVLSESKENNLSVFQSKYPEYHFYESINAIYIFSKAPIDIQLETQSKHRTSVVSFKTFETNFHVVDIMGSTDVPRSWGYKLVNSIVKPTDNTIVMGDFNVPIESLFMKPFKTHFNSAFSEKGNGLRETWFYNLPILSLDHIWVSKDLKILKTNKINSFKSDHDMIKTYIRL